LGSAKVDKYYDFCKINPAKRFIMHLNPSKLHFCHASPVTCHEIKNIIFDFGGVICNIDVKITERRFFELGLKPAGASHALPDPKALFLALESGKLKPPQFRDQVRKLFINPVTDQQIDDAWNALLLDIPASRIRLLEAIRAHYNIYLLSNTNEIHYRCYLDRFRTQFGYTDLDALFKKAYFSYRVGLQKPDPAIFRHVLTDSALNPAETLFIDDTLVHVEGAGKAGIQGYHLDLKKGEQITELFH
jgi:putative hydrolase of the HAD superfamily